MSTAPGAFFVVVSFPPPRNSLLPHALAVFAVGSALVYCHDLRAIYDTNNILRTGGMERNEVRPPVSHVVVYIPCSKYSG